MFASGEEDFYSDLFDRIAEASEEEDVRPKLEFVAQALFAFNTKDDDQGRRETTPQDVYKREIARLLVKLFELDEEGEPNFGDLFRRYDARKAYSRRELERIGRDVVVRVNAILDRAADVRDVGRPRACITSCTSNGTRCECSTGDAMLPCPVEACHNYVTVHTMTLAQKAKRLLSFMTSVAK